MKVIKLTKGLIRWYALYENNVLIACKPYVIPILVLVIVIALSACDSGTGGNPPQPYSWICSFGYEHFNEFCGGH